MGEVDEDTKTQNVTAGSDRLRGGLDEEAAAQQAHDPGRRDAVIAGNAAQDARWLSEQHGSLAEMCPCEQARPPPIGDDHRRRPMSAATVAATAPARATPSTP